MMFAGVFVGNDLCAYRMEPIVSARVIEVPMSIDQVRNWVQNLGPKELE